MARRRRTRSWSPPLESVKVRVIERLALPRVAVHLFPWSKALPEPSPPSSPPSSGTKSDGSPPPLPRRSPRRYNSLPPNCPQYVDRDPGRDLHMLAKASNAAAAGALALPVYGLIPLLRENDVQGEKPWMTNMHQEADADEARIQPLTRCR